MTLHEQIDTREQRLKAAEEIHRFHSDIADAVQRIQEKNAALGTDLGRDLNSALALLRKHETFENELVVLEAHLQVRVSNIIYIAFLCFRAPRMHYALILSYRGGWNKSEREFIDSSLEG